MEHHILQQTLIVELKELTNKHSREVELHQEEVALAFISKTSS